VFPPRQKRLNFWQRVILIFVSGYAFSVFPADLSNFVAGQIVRQSLPVLTNVAQIRALSPNEARRNYPVRLHGVVVYCSQKVPGNFTLLDATASVFVMGVHTNYHGVTRGQIVELEGVSEMVESASPWVRLLRLQLAGETEIPPPRAVTYDQLAGSNEDSQWVEVRGIIRSVSKVRFPAPEPLAIRLAMGGNQLIVRVEKYDWEQLQTLRDAEVRIRGQCFYFINDKGQIFNLRLSAQEMADIQVVRPAPENPFASPIRLVNQLMLANPEGRSEHRVRVQGLVTRPLAGGSFYIRDETQGIRVYTDETTPPLKLGDRVDVVGFPAMGEYSPVMQDAIFRRLESGPPLSPTPVTAQTALSHDAGLVRIQGRLLEQMHLPGELVLVVQTTNAYFNAHLPIEQIDGALSKLRNGSQVELTGICAVTVGDISDYLKRIDRRKPTSFRLLLRSADDVVVLRQSSWWTPTRVLCALAGVSAICLTAIIWVVALNCRVRAQTRIIQEKIEHETRLEERTRISRELHDTLQQALAGLRMQLDAGITLLEVAPERVRDALVVSRAMVDHSQSEARRSIWDLRSHVLETSGLPGAIRELITPLARGSNTQIELRIAGASRRLPVLIETNVLRIGQEAVTNALKHADAGRIRIELDYQPEELLLSIFDDGGGFEASASVSALGHFGLLGMRERAGKIKGRLQVQSRPGHGTQIELAVPIPPEPIIGSRKSKADIVVENY
jgi:signal transduction histidine kinase